jgi:primosomal protein N' (replication factor Y)
LENKYFIQAADDLAHRIFSGAGKIMASILPSRKICADLFHIQSSFDDRCIDKSNKIISLEQVILRGEYDERVLTLKKEIRSFLAKDRSVIVFTPTSFESETLFSDLKKGIEDRSFLLNGFQRIGQIKETIETLLSKQAPSLLVTTPSFAFMAGEIKTGLLVVDNESSDNYRSFRSPFVDFRLFADLLANALGINLIWSARFPRIETLHRIDNMTAQEINVGGKNLHWKSQVINLISDFNFEKDKISKRGEFQMSAILSFVQDKIKSKEKIFILCSRRGLSPKTICADCGRTVVCDHCGAPVFLHTKDKEGNFFFCHSCGKKKDALALCANCQSWNLKTFGYGIEGVYKWLSISVKDVPIWRIDRDFSESSKKITKIVDNFNSSLTGILLGTETTLKYIKDGSVDNVVIFDPASFFALPDFRSFEKTLRILICTRDKAKKNFALFTAELPKIINDALHIGIIDNFVLSELSDRKKFGFPPFKYVFKIEKALSLNEKGKAENYLLTVFEKEDLNILEDRKSPLVRKPILLRAILRLEDKYWKDDSLAKKFQELESESFSFEYDPTDPF